MIKEIKNKNFMMKIQNKKTISVKIKTITTLRWFKKLFKSKLWTFNEECLATVGKKKWNSLILAVQFTTSVRNLVWVCLCCENLRQNCKKYNEHVK